MIFSILLAILAAFLAVSAIILLAPITVSCSGSIKEHSAAAAEILGWWLHPKVLKCVVDIKKKAASVYAFGSFRIFSSEVKESPEEKGPVVPPKKLAGDEKKEPQPEPQRQELQERASISSRELPHVTAAEQPKSEKYEEPREEKRQSDVEGAGEKKPTFSEKLVPLKKVLVFLKDPSFRLKIFRWLKRTIAAVFSAVSMRIAAARVKAGLFDPSLTGAAYGYFTGLQYMVSTEKSWLREIQFEPVFNDEPFSAEGRVELSSSMARLCLPVIFAVLTFPYLHAYILYRKTKKIGQK
jgi:hypothetical protein